MTMLRIDQSEARVQRYKYTSLYPKYKAVRYVNEEIFQSTIIEVEIMCLWFKNSEAFLQDNKMLIQSAENW